MQRRIPSAALRFSLLATPLALMLAAGCGSNGTPQDTGSAAPQAMEPGPGGAPYAVIDGAVVPVPDIPMGNPMTIAAILDEGKNRNRVMDHLNYLCGDIGPRLTASTALERANRWCADRFESWGLSNGENRVWAEATLRFDRGPSYGRVLDRTEEGTFDEDRELQFTTLSWAPGTDGPSRGPVVRMPATIDELESARGSFDGAWVLISPYQGGRQGVRGIGRAMAARHVMHADLRQAMARGEMVEGAQPAAFPSDGVSGVWVGTTEGPSIPNGITDYSMTLTMAEDGTVTGIAGLPGLGYTPEIVNGSFADDAVTFDWPTPRGPRTMTFLLADGIAAMQAPDPESGEMYTFEAVLQQQEPMNPEDIERYIAQEILAEGPAGFVSSSRDERVWTTSVKRGEDLL
ncbi:MAG: hypothetical protein AAFY46_11740, partial [Planctomycetota bacterium]